MEVLYGYGETLRSDFMAKVKQSKDNHRASGLLKLFDQRVTFHEANEIAKSMSTRLPTLSEFILSLRDDPNLYDQSKGNSYWLSDRLPARLSEHCRINFEKGVLEKITEDVWKNLPEEQRAYVWKGKMHMAIFIHSDRPDRYGVMSLAFSERPDGVASVALADIQNIMDAARAALARLKRNAPK